MDAFVLIGGRSARMGTDKAELMVAGQRMADRVSAALMPHSQSVRFVGKCRPDWLEPIDFVADGAEARHPLHGVRAAMESARTPWVLIAPCDLVALRAEDVAQLVASNLFGHGSGDAEKHDSSTLQRVGRSDA